VNGRSRHAGTTLSRNRNTANAMMQAVIVTPRPQPVLRPTYRFEIDITPPITIPVTTARGDSCTASSPA
jgi:hypothetical protein